MKARLCFLSPARCHNGGKIGGKSGSAIQRSGNSDDSLGNAFPCQYAGNLFSTTCEPGVRRLPGRLNTASNLVMLTMRPTFAGFILDSSSVTQAVLACGLLGFSHGPDLPQRCIG
jgi:hypothetical protein